MTAHHLERGGGVVLANGHDSVEPRLDGRLPSTSAMSSSCGCSRRCPPAARQTAGRLVVGPRRRHRDQLPLRIAQRRQRAAEDAAGVDVDRAVDPLRLGHRRVAVDDRAPCPRSPPPSCSAPAARTRRSRRSSRRTGEARAPRPTPALHLLLQPGMGDDEPAAVEDVVADAGRREQSRPARGTPAARRRAVPSVSARPCADLHVAAAKLRSSLSSWLPTTAQRAARLDHVP